MIRKTICFMTALVLLLNVRSSLAAGSSSQALPLSVTSPDGRIELRILASPAKSSFEVRFNQQELVGGQLALCVNGTNLLENAAVKASSLHESDSTYSMPFGKNNPIRDHYRELTLDLENPAAPLKAFQVQFRAYNDGVAYRYVLPKQPGVKSIEITDEPGKFQFAGDPQVWPLYFDSYVNSHEAIHTRSAFSALASNRLIDVPLFAEFTNDVCVAFTEANLKNYAGLYVRAEDANGQKCLRYDLSPLPGKPAVKVRAQLPLPSPWRAFLIGSEPGRLVESDLLLNLNDPCAIGSTSWLQPGKTSFYWWNGIQEPQDPQQAFEWEKNYIDFCASNHIAFHAVIGTEGDHPWYYQTTGHYSSPGPDADVTRPRPGFEMAQLVHYARSKGVGIRVWVHWKPLSDHLEGALAQYQKWGLTGVMIDFLDHNNQDMVNFANRVVASAARHHLDVNFHGIWPPTGLERTYPNLFNHEGALNEEYLKWTERCTPGHDVTMAFTRMLAGPMDYHLGGFRGAYRDQFQHRVVKPVVYGTRCFQLAMYVVYENPLPMVCDTPDSYRDQPGFDFIQRVPTTWDETRVLSGQVGEDIVVARRKGPDWYIGAMTDWTPRSLQISLSFLPPGEYQVETWADAKGDPNPDHLVIQKQHLQAGALLNLELNSGGGEVICIEPESNRN
jgi:alpha-glucosidase